ncbi:MAG: hypothetical protein LBO76_02600, partial [Treponema sp.]|nr:hypothetical protein [Treponema sp.]
PVVIDTLEGVLYKNMLNDISFEIGDKIVVILEHQSTVNPNLPLRVLMYIARVYEKITSTRNVYGSKLLRIPRPEFIVLYNGTAPYPDKAELKLSDSFEGPLAGAEGLPRLDLAVTVYNINYGRNEWIGRRCGRLGAYSRFIWKVRELEAAEGDLGRAMAGAVKWCIENGVLRDFLETHGTEVANMLMAEWKLEDALVVEREEGREEGREQGLKHGLKRGREQGLKRGWEKGQGDMVRRLWKHGVDPAEIARLLDLSPDAVFRYLGIGIE